MKPKALSKYFFVFYLIQVKEKINTINIVRAISVIHHFLRPKLHYCVHTEQRKNNSKNYEKLGRMSTSKRKSLDQFYAKNKCITLANDFCRKNNKSIRTSSSAKTMKRPKIRRWPKNCPRPDSNGYIQKYYRGPLPSILCRLIVCPIFLIQPSFCFTLPGFQYYSAEWCCGELLLITL